MEKPIAVRARVEDRSGEIRGNDRFGRQRVTHAFKKAERIMSVVDEVKDELEARGEYVVLANTDWFAVFPATLQRRIEQAKARAQPGPNLVVYRTKSDDPRDHHVIPFALASELLVEDTLSDSATGGKRWNLTLGNGKLHVSHRTGKVEVSGFHRAPLIVELPTDDVVEFEKRAQCLRKLSLPRPKGQKTPAKRSSATRATYERCPLVKAWVLGDAKGLCELCHAPSAFLTNDDEPYFELHHVRQLAHGGSDTVENAVALCPSCHRRLHHGKDKVEQREQLYGQVARLLRETPLGIPEA